MPASSLDASGRHGQMSSITLLAVLLAFLIAASQSVPAANAQAVDLPPIQPSSAVSFSHSSTEGDRTGSIERVYDRQHSSIDPEARPRSIRDLTLSDVILVSSIEGGIYGLDRTSGQTKWSLPPRLNSRSRTQKGSSDDAAEVQVNGTVFKAATPAGFGPLLGTSYGPDRRSFEDLANNVPLVEESRTQRTDEVTTGHEALEALQKLGLYVVEPSAGQVYVLSTNTDTQGSVRTSLSKLPLTVPQLVELSPFSFPGDNSRVFVGHKSTTLVELDIRSGKIGAVFGGDEEAVIWCDAPIKKGPDSAECHHDDDSIEEWTYVGRTDYTLSIHLRGRPSLSQTLRFSTFSPNSADRDISSLWSQAGRSADHKALMGMPDEGTVVCFDARANNGKRRKGNDNTLWISELGATVAGIFDVVYPAAHLSAKSARPIIVPHPTQPLRSLFPSAPLSTILPNSETGSRSSTDAVHEHTTLLGISDGHLYAMNGQEYPLVSFSQRAPANFHAGNGHVHHDGQQQGSTPCTSFACLLGTYDMLPGDNDGPLGRDGYLGFEGGHSPLLGIGDGRQQGSDAKNSLPPGELPVATPLAPKVSDEVKASSSSIFSWNPSPMMIMVQIVALLLLAVLCGLIYVGAQELQRQRAEEANALAKDMIWKPRVEKEEDAKEEVIQSEPAEAAEAPAIPRRDPEEVAQELLREEAAAAAAANTTALEKKKPAKRRKRGKRAGQAVQRKEKWREGPNNEDESGEEEGEDDLPLRGSTAIGLGMSRSGTEESMVQNGWIDTQTSADEQAIKLAAKTSMSAEGGSHVASPNGTMVARGNQSLLISDEVLGYGSSGTIVFKGTFQGRAVAVKRLLRDFVDVASKEVSLLESADNHANVIRYFYKEVTSTFLFIALELCPASLADIIDKPHDFQELSAQLDPKRALFQIASGLQHLHSLSIVHRDIKPQNILVSPSAAGKLKMMLSDFGLSKRLDGAAQTSFSQTMNNPGGTVGWRAPEILRGDVSLDMGADGSSSGTTTMSSTNTARDGSGSDLVEKKRLTRAVDIFAMGCLTYYVLSNGEHPFGSRYEREMNIIRKQVDLQRLDGLGEEGHEAQHLVLAMIAHEAKDRPDATKVMSHPYFWSPGRRLTFLQDASDRLDIMEKDPPAPTLVAMEINSAVVVGTDWHRKIDKQFMEDIGKRRKYDGKSVVDLLRAIRNKKHHIHDLPPNLKRLFGGQTDGFLAYFTTRFPRLFLHTYEVIDSFAVLKSEATFAPYFAPLRDDM